MARRMLVGIMVACLGLLIGAPAGALPASRPAVMGGTPALGSPVTVSLAVFDGSQWRTCTATLLRPRVLLTAAHCLTKPDSDAAVTKIRVFPPGVKAVVYANTGPRRPSPIRAAAFWRAPGFRSSGGTVQANDVAVILLKADLAPGAFTRIATREEIVRWRAARMPLSHVGYGRTGLTTRSWIPNAVILPLRSVSLNSSLGVTFTTDPSQTQSVCPGDSGGPVFASPPGFAYLVGTLAGANSVCSPAVSVAPSVLGFAAIGYLSMINSAYARAGYVTIPSAPTATGVAARNRDVTVRWSPPQLAPETVVAYDVLDPNGAVVCEVPATQNACVLPGLPDGRYAYTVRARNSEGSGDALPADAAATVAAPPMPATPSILRVSSRRVTITIGTLVGRTSAVITSYVVRDNNGSVVCTLAPQPADATQLSCPGPTRRGTYTVSVHAETEMGPSPESPQSARFTIR